MSAKLLLGPTANYRYNDRVMERPPIPSPPLADTAEDDDELCEQRLRSACVQSTGGRVVRGERAGDRSARGGRRSWMPVRMRAE